MDKKESPIKFLISSAIKSQSTSSLMSPMVRTPPVVTDLFKSKTLQSITPQSMSSESVLTKPVSPLTLCFGGRTIADTDTQTETVVKCEMQSQTDLSVSNQETQTEDYKNDLHVCPLPQIKDLAEKSTQTLEMSESDSDIEPKLTIQLNNSDQSLVKLNNSDQSLVKLCENSSQTEMTNSTLSQSIKIKESIIEEINALEEIQNQMNYAESIDKITTENQVNANMINRAENNQNVNKIRRSCCYIL